MRVLLLALALVAPIQPVALAATALASKQQPATPPGDTLPTTWNREAIRLARQGLLPFTWLPEWFAAAQRFRELPGQDVEVIEQICGWTPSRLDALNEWLKWLISEEASGRPLPPALGPARMRAAALLHTYGAMCQALSGRAVLRKHIVIAHRLLGRFDEAPNDDGSLVLLWHKATARWFASFGRFDDAIYVASLGLGRFPDDAELPFLRGTFKEAIASPLFDWYDYAPTERVARERMIRAFLAEAQEEFGRALARSPGFVRARLHLGRVLALLGRTDQARAALDAARAVRDDPETAFLANLFLGRLDERAHRYPDAVAAYTRAFEILPAQSAALALAHVLDRTGNRPEARRTLDALDRLPGEREAACGDTPGADHARSERTCDPWLQYNLIDLPALRQSIGELTRRVRS